MKALDPEKQLRRDSEKGGGGGALHKPNESAKQQAFEKHSQPNGRPRKPNNKKDKDSHKGAIIGAAAAGVAVIGVGAVIAHNMNNNGSKTASEKANEHSKDTGLSFGDDSDDDSSSSSKKKSKDKDSLDLDSSSSSKKNKSKSKSKKSKSKLDSLLDGDDSDTTTLLGDDISGVSLGGSSGKGSKSSLSALAAQAKKSANSAKALGGSGSSSSSKSSSKGGKSNSNSPKVVDTDNTNQGSGVITPLSNKTKGGSNGNASSGKVINGKTNLVNDNSGKTANGGKTSITEPDNNSGNNGGNSSNGSSGTSNSGSDSGKSSSNNNSSKDNSKDNSSKNNSSKDNNNSSKDNNSKGNDSSKDNSGKSDNTKPSKPTTPTSPTTESKTITYIDSDGNVLGTGKLTKTTENGQVKYALDASVPAGYWVADNTQLLNYPNTVVVQKTNTSKNDKGDSLVSQKVVSYVDKTSGKAVGQGIIYKWKSSDGSTYCTADSCPVGYVTASSNEDIDKYPDVIYVKEGSDFVFPADKIKEGTTKTVDMVLADGTKVGTAKLTKLKDGVQCDLGTAGYKLSDLDSDGESDQLMQWPDKVTVVKTSSDSGKDDDKPDTPTAETKTASLVDESGTQVGTVTLQKASNGTWSIKGSLPSGYKLKDSSAVAAGPDKLTVVKEETPVTPTTETKTVKLIDEKGTQVGTVTLQKGSDGNWTIKGSLPAGYELNDASAVASGPSQLVVIKKGGTTPETTSKSVTFVDESGKEMGKGTLTKDSSGKWSVVENTLPNGYKVKDANAVASGPDKVTVVKVDTTVKPTEESKTVTFVDESGKTIEADGKPVTAKLTRKSTGNGSYSYELSGHPYGYKLKSEDELKDYPDKLTVVVDPSAQKPGTSVSKTVPCVTADGKQVGTVTLTKTIDSSGKGTVKTSTLPKGYQLVNNDSSQLSSYPDKLTVEPVKVKNKKSYNVTYVDSAGKTLGTGTVTITTYSDNSHDYTYDKAWPSGYTLSNPGEQLIDEKTQLPKAGISKIVLTKTN